ncbi:MAG: hypothetical protein Q7R96_06580 [Nanoarchaeota archaeon]|nr:hypothetical protein [Nanoarchaeota archaeon]
MKAYMELIIGLLLMIGMAWLALSYDRVFLAVMRFVLSGLLVAVFLLGAGLTLLGLSDLKE